MRLNSFEYTDGEKIGESPVIDKNQFCSAEDLNNIASALNNIISSVNDINDNIFITSNITGITVNNINYANDFTIPTTKAISSLINEEILLNNNNNIPTIITEYINLNNEQIRVFDINNDTILNNEDSLPTVTAVSSFVDLKLDNFELSLNSIHDNIYTKR